MSHIGEEKKHGAPIEIKEISAWKQSAEPSETEIARRIVLPDMKDLSIAKLQKSEIDSLAMLMIWFKSYKSCGARPR